MKNLFNFFLSLFKKKVEVVETSEEISEVVNQLSLSEAKRLSLLHWQSILVADGNECLSIVPEECMYLKCLCGFCQRWNYIGVESAKESCSKCEFGKIAGQCVTPGSLWTIFDDLQIYSDDFVDSSDIINKRIIANKNIIDVINLIEV